MRTRTRTGRDSRKDASIVPVKGIVEDWDPKIIIDVRLRAERWVRLVRVRPHGMVKGECFVVAIATDVLVFDSCLVAFSAGGAPTGREQTSTPTDDGVNVVASRGWPGGAHGGARSFGLLGKSCF